ncbi:hypothetical protein RHMOL_Rhmol01G0126900 [Rhododendron molle]|uniref:Uncharacterized protein n=1 Tax=Rhododendron molle TaxID=49168 RepID=A0ACC0Q2B7_RHOML|nr:hypothetical protein RHMOL_Rhmol01G0126900 [Rhododendron molle]
MQILRHTRTMRLRAFRDNIAKEGGRQMVSPRKRRAHRQKSRLKDLDDAQTVQAFKPFAMHKCKRVYTIEDSCNEPHMFCAPKRRVLH